MSLSILLFDITNIYVISYVIVIVPLQTRWWLPYWAQVSLIVFPNSKKNNRHFLPSPLRSSLFPPPNLLPETGKFRPARLLTILPYIPRAAPEPVAVSL